MLIIEKRYYSSWASSNVCQSIISSTFTFELILGIQYVNIVCTILDNTQLQMMYMMSHLIKFKNNYLKREKKRKN